MTLLEVFAIPSVSGSAIINAKGEVVRCWNNEPQLYYIGEYRYIGSRIQLDKETLCSCFRFCVF